MRKYGIPQPRRVRRIEKSFAWIDHRLLRNGYRQVMTHQDQTLYLFLVLVLVLVLVADRHGVSFYRKGKICEALSLDWPQFEVARDRLILRRRRHTASCHTFAAGSRQTSRLSDECR